MDRQKVGLVCDSTADFPRGMAEELGLHILPVHIMVDGQDHLHGVSISNRDVIEALKQRREVYTKPFYPHECADFFENLLSRYDRVVSLHLSTELSGNYLSATSATQLMFEEDAARIRVLDLKGVSVSLGLAVRKAAELLQADPNPDTLETRLRPCIDNLFMGFTVEDLAYLRKGGRVGALSAFLGGMLDIKPIIQLERARLVPKEKMRGKKPALKRLVEMAESQYRKLSGACHIWLAYADNVGEALETRERLADRIQRRPEDIQMVEVGATISVHTGPGAVCIGMSPA